jgi:ribosomal-protein-serine acetyltransferase
VRSFRWPIDDRAWIQPFTVEDAEELFALVDANRERLARWFPWVDGSTGPDTQRAFIERCIASETDLEGNGIWVGAELAGGIGMRVDVIENNGEIGYWLDNRFEGRGLVTRGCALFIEHGFRVMGLHRIAIRAAVDNARSRAVAERLGFTQEGIGRESGRVGGGRYVNLVEYGLLDREWRA